MQAYLVSKTFGRSFIQNGMSCKNDLIITIENLRNKLSAKNKYLQSPFIAQHVMILRETNPVVRDACDYFICHVID